MNEGVVAIEELRREAERARSAWAVLEEDAEEAIDEAWRAYADGDTVLERQWRKRAEERQLAADRAMDRLAEAEEAIGEAEYERENPEG